MKNSISVKNHVPMRVGILGAAPIAVDAVIKPAQHVPGVVVHAIAARDESRAERYAQRHAIPKVHPAYAALLDDPTIDSVYIPLPNSLHATWATRALRAGKHVLCEKPLAANAAQAKELQQVAEESGRVLVEAMHYRYHPLAARLQAIIASGEIGEVRHIEAEFSVPLLQPRSIQFRYDLAGGATMDVGCYAIDLIRLLAGAEPHVLDARARLLGPQIDRFTQARFRFDDGRTASMTCALLSARLLRLGASVHGTAGRLEVMFPFLPHIFNQITVRTGSHVRHEQVRGATSYAYQLAAFVQAVREGTPTRSDVSNAIANMHVIDEVYRRAGLLPRT